MRLEKLPFYSRNICHRRINCVGSPADEPSRGSGAAPVKTGGGNRAAGAIICLWQGYRHSGMRMAFLGSTRHYFVRNVDNDFLLSSHLALNHQLPGQPIDQLLLFRANRDQRKNIGIYKLAG